MTTEAEGKAEYACYIHSIDFGHICTPWGACIGISCMYWCSYACLKIMKSGSILCCVFMNRLPGYIVYDVYI